MKRYMVALVASMVSLMLLASGVACSFVDKGDEVEFEEAIKGQPVEVRLKMSRAVLNKRALDYLKTKNGKALVVGVECRSSTDSGATWTGWTPENIVGDYDVETLIHCIANVVTMTYHSCLDGFVEGSADEVHNALDTLNANNDTLSECRAQVNPGFNEVEVPGVDTPLNSVSLEDMVNWILASPSQPPGFDPTVWEALAPFVCAMGTTGNWGCPGSTASPTSPVVIMPAPSGGDSGGHP